jgi:hypothetical protein
LLTKGIGNVDLPRYLKEYITVVIVDIIILQRFHAMLKEKTEKKNREGIPMNESDLKEWKQTFIDIQESIDKVMKEGEDFGRPVKKDSKKIC